MIHVWNCAGNSDRRLWKMGSIRRLLLHRRYFHISIIAHTHAEVNRKLQIITKIFTFLYSLRNLKKQKTIILQGIRKNPPPMVTKLIPYYLLTSQQPYAIIEKRWDYNIWRQWRNGKQIWIAQRIHFLHVSRYSEDRTGGDGPVYKQIF